MKEFFENLLKNYDSERYFITELESELEFNQIPEDVREACNVYKQEVDDINLGAVKVYKIFVDIIVFYVVYVIENKNSSYLEVYSQSGEQMACINYDGKFFDLSNQESICVDLD